MTYPGNTKLPEGMTVDRAAKIMLLALCNAFADVVRAGGSRGEQFIAAGRATGIVTGLFVSVMDANKDKGLQPDEMRPIFEMLDQFEDWVQGEAGQ